MALVALLVLCTLPAATHQLTFAAEQTELSSELSAQRTFADSANLLHALEADMAHLAQAFHGPRSPAALVQLQSELSTAPVAAAAVAAKPKVQKKKSMDATTALKAMDKMDKLSPGQMAPMLGLLGGMYDSWKEKIGEANKHEQDQKAVFEKTISDLEAKKTKADGSKGALDTYDRIEAYWKRQRSISHRQYHTALKIMHSGMQKFKSVSSAMKDAIDGKKPSAKDLQAVGMAMPDVVFLQTEVRELAVWTQTASEDVHTALGF